VPPGGYAYICGERYNDLPNKAPWTALEPGESPPPLPVPDVKFRPKPKKKPESGTRRMGGRRR